MKMAVDYAFSEDDMAIDESVGYPRAYEMLCRDLSASPFSNGPPYTFIPYSLQHHEAVKGKELDKMFEIIDLKAKPTTKPKIFVSLLWKQLDHLGNAGFDPAVIRVDPYGNVLYYHADSASPLSWDIDHWFPCSRGGLTVLSNLRILQWQVCKKKHNNLEFLIPWWEFQSGISVNQFLSIFASSNSDFRHRAFSFLFAEGENEELNSSQTVDSHSFPQHFVESKKKFGLAPAAVVVSRRRESYGSSSVLRSLDYNKQLRSQSPATAGRKVRPGSSKENENPDLLTNPYQAIVMARDSLKQREETLKKQSEIQKLDDEVREMRQTNEEEKLNIQDLELTLIKRKRKAEKCRRLAEAQSSYKNMLEKMIRDTMHQSVIYKEQLRLNQAASKALMARLEAQKEICDEAEKDLHKKYKQRDELEKQIRSDWEQGRKRLRMNDDDTLIEERDHKAVLCLPGIKSIRTPVHKELRVFLEEEQKASEAGLSMSDKEKRAEIDKLLNRHFKISVLEDNQTLREHDRSIVAVDNGNLVDHNLRTQEIEDENTCEYRVPTLHGPETEEDEERRKQRGKDNLEKWLQMLLEDNNTQEEMEPQDDEHENKTNKTDDIIRKINLIYPLKDIKNFKHPEHEDKGGITAEQIDQKLLQIIEDKDDAKGKEEKMNDREKSNMNVVHNSTEGVESSKSLGGKEREEREEQNGMVRKPVRSENARAFRRIPSSPSLILGMKKGVDCIGKKPKVSSDDEEHAVESSFITEGVESSKSLGGKEREEQNGMERKPVRSENAKAFHRIPSLTNSGYEKGCRLHGKEAQGKQ